MKVSIIIPVFDDAIRLEECLKNLDRQTFSKDEYEVLVVDNNSTEDIKSVTIDFPNAKYLYARKPGSYAARNLGIKMAKGELLGFTDSDTLPKKNWIGKAFIYFCEDKDLYYLGGKVSVFAKNKNHPTFWERYEQIYAFPQEHNIQDKHYSVTANLFVKKALFEKIGYFNEDYLSGGDGEFGRRAYLNNFKQTYAEDVIVSHPARRTWEEMISKHQRVAKGHFTFLVSGEPTKNRRYQSRMLFFSSLFLRSFTVPNIPLVWRVCFFLAFVFIKAFRLTIIFLLFLKSAFPRH